MKEKSTKSLRRGKKSLACNFRRVVAVLLTKLCLHWVHGISDL